MFNPKNTGDQIKFKINCAAYIANALALLSEYDMHIRYDDIPINIKRIVQTIGNNIAGGASDGITISL